MSNLYQWNIGAQDSSVNVTAIFKGDHLIIKGKGDIRTNYSFQKKSKEWTNATKTIKNVSIKRGITSIGYGTFNDCDSLVSISIPNTVKRIGDSSFAGCDNLTTLKIPNSIVQIDGTAFAECKNLTTINIPENLTKIAPLSYALTGISGITIPSKVSVIG
jgi:hypothetical protein